MKKLLVASLLTFKIFSLDLDYIQSKGYEVYRIKQDESLRSVAEKIYPKLNYKYQSIDEFERYLLEWNPHLKKVATFTGQVIYIKNPYSPHLSYKWAPDLYQSEAEALAHVDWVDMTNGLKKENRAPASVRKTPTLVSFFHATVSQGKFLEDISGNKIDSQQNSPFTIGAGLVYLPPRLRDYSFATSVYYSNLKPSIVNDGSDTVTNTNLKLPPEIGLNLYAQRSMSRFFTNIYGGFDYEEFNLLNFDKIVEGETTALESQRQKVLFGTIGGAFTFTMINPTTVKVSYSQGIASNNDINGGKYMLYMNQKLTQNFWYHILYKQHLLNEGNREISISRYGVGVGVAF